MRTITPYVMLQYCRRYGVFWTIGFLVRYFTHSGIFSFRVPGYGAWIFRARKGSSDVRVFNQVVLRRSYLLPIQLPPVRFIVDAGANAGYSALFFANAHPDASILAIEPDQSNFEMLCSNVRNAVGRISTFHGALWPVKTRLRIQNPNAPKTAIMVGKPADNSGDVPTTTVPEIIRERGFIDILKMDIEGAEIEIFASEDLAWLDQVGCLIIELHDFMRAGCSMAFYRAICSRRFSQHISGENLIIRFENQRRPAYGAT